MYLLLGLERKNFLLKIKMNGLRKEKALKNSLLVTWKRKEKVQVKLLK